MGTKTVRLDEHVYERIRRQRRPGETFSEAIDRLIETHSLSELGGVVDERRMKKKKGDAAIGATADVEGEPVLTRNVDDSEALGFAVETY